MNVTCPNCTTRYSVDDAKVPPSGVTIRCPKCQQVFVAKKDGQVAAPRAQSAVALPGNAAPGSRGAPVPLPGATSRPSAAPAPSRPAPQPRGDDGDLDLGLEHTPPPSVSAPAKGPSPKSDLPAPKGPGRPPAARASSVAGMSAGESLDFIDDVASRAGAGRSEANPELRVRRRNGRVEGPFGLTRIATMIRNKEFTGGEDISEDGVQWRSMTSNPELNRVINELAAEQDAMSFGNVDLGGGDEPPRAAPKAPPKGGGYAFTKGGQENAAEGLELSAPLGGADPERALFDDAESGSKASPLAPPPKGAKAGPEALQVGDIPELPPLWQTYKKPILAFAGLILVFLIGFFTQLWTPCGAYGVKCIAKLWAPPPPPPPEKPPPPPPKVADAKEIASLIDEGSYEGFRSVFATVAQLGPSVPDNMLAAAKARGLATLSYPKDFPPDQLAKDVEALNTLDISQAMGGNTALANSEMLKARAALLIVGGQVEAAKTALAGALEQRGDDKELALLLGIARQRGNDPNGAMEALDKAVVADRAYAPAMHVIGEVLEAQGQLPEAASFYQKALEAQPAHSISAVAAAAAYAKLNTLGPRRRVLALGAEKASRGLPPEQRAPFLFEAATALAATDLYDRALPLAMEAQRLDPANNVYTALAARVSARAGKLPEAKALIDPVLVRAPNDVDALLARAEVMLGLEDVAKAFLDLDAAKKAAPKDARVPLLEASFQLELAKFNDAREALNRAVKLDPKLAAAYVELGRIDLRLGDVDSALNNATTSVKEAPANAAAHALLADCYSLRDEVERALAEYETALKLDDESLPARLGFANALRDMGAKNPKLAHRVSESVPIYLKALGEHPKNPTIMFEYGRALEIQNDVHGALELYREASLIDEKDVRPHLKMAAAFIEQTPPDLPQAKKAINTARRIEGGGSRQDATVRYWEARLALLEKRVHEAVAAMRSAVETEPRNAVYHYWLGRVLEENNSLYEAIGYYEKATSLNSRLAVAHRALGRTALERNQFEKAREHFARFREAAPDDFSIWLDVGESYGKQNKDDEAKDAFEKVLKSDAKNARALLEIGAILDRKGQADDALRYFERAAAAQPDLGDPQCYVGLALHSRGKRAKEAKAALTRCLELPSSDDLKANAKEALESVR